MKTDPAIQPSQRDFLQVAKELKFLTADEARTLRDQATQNSTVPSLLAIQQGLLTTGDVDIVQTMLQPKECVPGYEILGVVGKGGMGVVYRARQANLDRQVALKTVLVNRMADPASLARFEQEAMAVARLQHPHIVAAYDFGRHAGRLYFAMEWLEGEDAEHLIERSGALDEATAWGLARQAAAGLAHAAEMGIVHRDIKPANLLLVSAPAGYAISAGLPMVKIADFGVAFLTSQREQETRLTVGGSVVGSPYYLAPEQLRDEPVDYRADIYALGATVFHLLAGHPPFVEKSLAQVIAAKIGAPPPSLRQERPDISLATEQLVNRMMACNPIDRPEGYERLFAEIDAIMLSVPRTEPLTRKTPSLADTATIKVDRDGTTKIQAATEPRLAPRRMRIRLIMLALASLIALAVIALAWWEFSPGNRARRSLRRELVESGWEQPLFQGKSVNVWRNLSGVWKLDKDDEGGTVLAGENGSLPYELPSVHPDRRQPPEYYRLTLQVKQHEAKQIEIRFAFVKESDTFLALRITKQGVQLGNGSRAGKWNLIASHWETPSDKYHVVGVERHPNAWWVLWDERIVGVVPYSGIEHRAEFRLGVEAGPAWFSDVLLEELVSPNERRVGPDETLN